MKKYAGLKSVECGLKKMSTMASKNLIVVN